MRITKIEIQKRRPDRRNIYADGVFLLGVASETLLRTGLRTGDELTPEQIAALEATENLISAKNAALRLLSVRPRTQKELRDRLRGKEFSDEEIERCLRDLTDAGLVNDREFARMFVRDRIALRPEGKNLITRKLILLGLEKEMIAEVLDEILQPGDQRTLAQKAAAEFLAKKAKSRKPDDPRKTQQQLTAFLLRRGYAWDVISSVVKHRDLDES